MAQLVESRLARLAMSLCAVVSAVGLAVLAPTLVGAPPATAMTPLYAYVTNGMSNNVSVIDTSTNKVVTSVPVGSGPDGIAITPDGSYAYVANSGSNNVSVINTSTNIRGAKQ